ncbi:MAG: ectoine hydroxylase [Nitrosomonas sp.]|nr:ectoine hydroxylase [Nitrosomonas sp.]
MKKQLQEGFTTVRADSYPSRVRAVSEILARQDPVVYSDWTDNSPLTRAQTENYLRDGFLALPNLFSPNEVACLQCEMTTLQSGGRAINSELLIREPGSSALRSVFKIHEANQVYARLASDHRLVSIARFLLGDDVYIHQSRLNFKPAFRGKEFYWHSDFETWHIEDGMPHMRALSMSIALTSNNGFNGPLMLIPGSHRKFIACVGETPENHYIQSLRKQEYGVPDDDSLRALTEDGGIEAPMGPIGTVVLFDCNTMHGSNSNITPFPRSNFFVVYNALSNKLEAPFSGQPPRPYFLAERGTPDALPMLKGDIT